MRILAIESSADDTAIALLEVKRGKFTILAHEKTSQAKLHEKYGGIYPNLAKNEHIKNLPKLLKKITARFNLAVGLIAVTTGPGLEPCLWAGITFAEDLAQKLGVPLIPVNHMEGHILSVFAHGKQFSISNLQFPILSLLVSGGHTELVLVKGWGKYKILGRTLDDAVGEAFDKVARMLGLPYPGGPQISALAEIARKSSDTPRTHAEIRLPRPMLKHKNFDFSFAGLKTAVYYLTKGKKLTPSKTAELALEFENAAIETLTTKTFWALQKHKPKALIVAGGVAANQHLRKEIKKITKNVLFPSPELATDNAIMIGLAGYWEHLRNPKKKPARPAGGFKIRAMGSLKLGEMIK